jgi:Tol biopolymer transport system component
VVLLGLLLASACGTEKQAALPSVGDGIAPRPSEAGLVMWRGVAGNSPTFDIVVTGKAAQKLTVVVGMSAHTKGRPRLFDEPAWSPDGEGIAFTADLTEADEKGFFHRTDIYVVNADGSDLRRLTDDGLSSSPVWSPDGKTIAYARRTEMDEPTTFEDVRQMSTTLWTMTAEGTDERPVFEPVPGRLDEPGGWSPDGSRFVFTRAGVVLPGEGGNGAAIYVMNADGSDLTRLAEQSGNPAWSPDGTKIVFASDRDGNGGLNYGDNVNPANELYVMDADGSNQARLTETKDVNEARPGWSPDGALIAYQRGEVVDNAQGTGVFVMKPDGSCPTAVAFDEELYTWFASPDWYPGASRTSMGALACGPDPSEGPPDEAAFRWGTRADAVCRPWASRRAEAIVNLDEDRLHDDFAYFWRVMRPIDAGIVRDLEALGPPPVKAEEALALYKQRLAQIDRAVTEYERGHTDAAFGIFDDLNRDSVGLGAAFERIHGGACSP